MSGFKFTYVLELLGTGKTVRERITLGIRHLSGSLMPTLLTPAVHFEDK
jgi:hypothetical protein